MAARKTRRQLQFTGFEMTLIAASFVVTVTVVFFLGLFVGKKNASHHAPAEDRVARVPVEDFSRYKRPSAAAKAAATSAEEGGVGGAAAATSGPGGGESARKPAEPSDSAKPAKASQETAKAEASRKAEVSRKAAAEEAAAKASATKEEAAKPEASTGHGYTVQILATRREADADALVRKLKSRGYAAYVKKISDGAGAWYRVRVGSFGAFSEARAMADKCRHDLGLGQAFVSTE